MSAIDQRSIVKTEILTLKIQKSALQLKKLIGLASKIEIDEIDRKIKAAQERLRNMPWWMK